MREKDGNTSDREEKRGGEKRELYNAARADCTHERYHAMMRRGFGVYELFLREGGGRLSFEGIFEPRGFLWDDCTDRRLDKKGENWLMGFYACASRLFSFFMEMRCGEREVGDVAVRAAVGGSLQRIIRL